MTALFASSITITLPTLGAALRRYHEQARRYRDPDGILGAK